MTPEDYCKSGTEFAHQVSLFMWAAFNSTRYPELKWFHAIKNEEKSGSKVMGARAKQSGIKRGVSDTLLPVKRGKFSGLYIEMKAPDRKPCFHRL